MTDYKGKVALVTGGTKGIGLGIVQSLLDIGMHVAFTGRSAASIKEALESISEGDQHHVLGLVADVRDYAAQKQTVNDTLARWGRIDVLIANAGVGHFANIEDMTEEQWNETIDINLTGVFYSLKACLNALVKSQGYFISISSLAGTNFFAKGAAYNASKFGLVGFTQAVMLDLRKHGIKSTTIMPGSVSTNFNNHQPTDADAWKIQPEDIGQMVVDLLRMNPRTLPSKIEVRPTMPPGNG